MASRDAAGEPAEDDGDPEADDAYDYLHESLGELDFELDAAGVEAILGAPAQKTPVAEQDADGAFATTWLWPAQGVEIRFAADSERGQFKVSSIAVRAPCRLRTSRGVGLGSTAAAIEAAYGREHTHVDASSVLVGSTYGGLLFELEDGKVSSIFIGASAE
jgi:hypothetical protein